MPESCLLYYITDRSAFEGNEPARCKRLLEKIAEAAYAGVDYIQLREKDLSPRHLELLARDAVAVLMKLRTENPELRTKLLINSRTDVALAACPDGVHLRSDDIPPQQVRAIWKKACGAGALASESIPREPLIAVSCHTHEEVNQAAESGAAFAVFAPVFEKMGATPAGLTRLHEACNAAIPVLALGGITLENAKSCMQAGAAGISAIRLFQENKIFEVVQELRKSK
jgi:thiamine-phosphate pyrophosphorylase